ncbi:MAG TPA: hypothetical protein VJH65_01315 [Candidatus Nanoarchaeia archaeon]|nr:hypothetical protein [Candidatus Nanoarchaeia archaeon]
MRHFVYFSKSAVTSGKFKDLVVEGGRMDIAIHTIIASFFLSHAYRKDVVLHLVFYGPPDPPKHIEISVKDELEINKKDIATIIRKILYKYHRGEKKEVLPGCFIEKKSFLKVIDEMQEDGKEIFILDKRGEDIRNLKDDQLKNAVFILGDHEGLPKKEIKRLKSIANKVSIGPLTYFASQTVAIVNNELDRRDI